MEATHDSTSRSTLGDAALALGVLGLLPIPGLAASVAALICGYTAERNDDRAHAGVILGWIGVAVPVVLLFIYCVVLGNPFPIHRYHPSE